ncbi:MAG: hypothetical protein ACLR6O_06905 [Eubacterium sp.]
MPKMLTPCGRRCYYHDPVSSYVPLAIMTGAGDSIHYDFSNLGFLKWIFLGFAH